MKRILSTALLIFAFQAVANAIIVQKVMLKNGSVLEGYIQSQDGSGKMTVHTDRAVIYIKSAYVDVLEHKVKIDMLDKTWKEWAEKNDAYEGQGSNRVLMLNDLLFKSNLNDSSVNDRSGLSFEDQMASNIHSASNVKVLERGVMVKYLELTPNNYVVSWNDIKSINADRRSKTALSGINRIYELKNGKSFEGQYAEETDNSLSLYMPNNMIQSFDINDVIKYTFRPINPNQDIFEQSELVDVIKTRRGGTVRGIILEQNYASKKDSENLFLVQTASGAIQTIKVSEISEIRKEENPKYNPKFDIMLNNGEVVINRKQTSCVRVTEYNDLLILDSISHKVEIDRNKNGATKIVVEYRMDNGTNVDVFQLIKVSESKVKKSIVYCFSYKDLVNTVYRPVLIETSVNKTTKAEYEIPDTGIFALYDARNKKALPLIIK